MQKNLLWIHVIFLSLTAIVAKAQVSEEKVIVKTESGSVQGRTLNEVTVFKSIPYAAAPVGNLRFAAPVKHEPWAGVRDATKSGPTAPFNKPAKGDINDNQLFGNGWIKGDDFLTNNIWTPHVNKKLPVMVFIHGGAFVIGTSDVPLFDGTSFAKKGVVLVSMNYRMGIEGFLKIKDVPTNIGIRDQIASLRWVKDNIAAFGGDPDNVTIFGESAGAISVGVLLVSPAAKGLFKRGIMQSGSGQAVLSGEQADKVAKEYSKTLRIKNTREEYLKFSPEELLAAQPKVIPKKVKLGTESHADPTGGVTLFFPVIDGKIVPDVPLKTMQNEQNHDYDLLLGYNTDEINYFLIPTGLLKKIKFNFILKKAVRMVHPAPSAVIATYKQVYPKKNLGQLLSAILTSYQAQVPSVRFANAHSNNTGKTFMYEFAWPSSVKGGAYGAYHGVELPFVFNTINIVKGEGEMLGPQGGPADLADKMQDAWVQFANSGNPGWDAYNATDRKTMLISTTWTLQIAPHAKVLGAWDGIREY